MMNEERERVAEALCAHFAVGHLQLQELERRLAGVYAARSPEELYGIVADLPRVPDKYGAGPPAVVAPDLMVPARGVVVAIMGGNARKGKWLLPRYLKVFVLAGGAEIDLRNATFSAGESEIDVTVIMGGVEIVVPPGVRVETIGGAVMGGFEADAGDTSALGEHSPLLRVTGFAAMGGVEVKTRTPTKKMLTRFESAVSLARRLPRPRYE